MHLYDIPYTPLLFNSSHSNQNKAFPLGFNYPQFRRKVLHAGLTPGQLEPLKKRFDTQERFMPQDQVSARLENRDALRLIVK